MHFYGIRPDDLTQAERKLMKLNANKTVSGVPRKAYQIAAGSSDEDTRLEVYTLSLAFLSEIEDILTANPEACIMLVRYNDKYQVSVRLNKKANWENNTGTDLLDLLREVMV